MNKLINRVLLLSVIAVGGLSGCQPQQQVPAQSGVSSARTEPSGQVEAAATEAVDTEAVNAESPKTEIIQVDYAGFQEQLKKLAGKMVVVDVWSTGCPPCMKEYPNLVALSQRWPDQVVCVSYNVDYIGQKSKPVESYLPKVGGFLEAKKSSTVVNLISSEPDSDVFEKLEIASIPVVMLFDREGKLIKKFTEANSGEDGLTYDADIIPEIEAALSPK